MLWLSFLPIGVRFGHTVLARQKSGQQRMDRLLTVSCRRTDT
ncbi:hypothetical protein X975_24322, partial [Stegodyphus mimosarum]